MYVTMIELCDEGGMGLIRIGMCVELDFVPEAAGTGFDYLELPLARIAALSGSEFGELAGYMDALRVPVRAMYAMLPDELRVTGPDVQARLQHAYLEEAFARARRLGAQTVAFDAAASRRVPGGFDFALARRQAGNFLRIVQGLSLIHICNWLRPRWTMDASSHSSLLRIRTRIRSSGRQRSFPRG